MTYHCLREYSNLGSNPYMKFGRNLIKNDQVRLPTKADGWTEGRPAFFGEALKSFSSMYITKKPCEKI